MRRHLHPAKLVQECPPADISHHQTMPESAATPTTDPASHDSASGGGNSPSQQPVQGGWRRSFWALIVTQFQGAFSINVLRYLLTFMVLGTALSKARTDALVSLITLLFFVPLILFSMAGGFLADRFSKRQVTVATKLIEVGGMVTAI